MKLRSNENDSVSYVHYKFPPYPPVRQNTGHLVLVQIARQPILRRSLCVSMQGIREGYLVFVEIIIFFTVQGGKTSSRKCQLSRPSNTLFWNLQVFQVYSFTWGIPLSKKVEFIGKGLRQRIQNFVFGWILYN